MSEINTGTGNGPATVSVEVAHGRNRDLRVEYLGLEKQLTEPGVTPEVVRRVKYRQARILDQVVKANAGLVQQFVSPFSNEASSAVEDYRQEGFLSMIDAWKRWDPESAPFASFAWHYVRGAVNRSVRLIEKPQINYNEWSAIPTVRATRTRLATTLGREPSVQEVATATGLYPGVVERALTPSPTSLDAPLRGEEDGASLYGVIANRAIEATADVDTSLVVRCAELLDARQLPVWLLRTGMAGSTPLDLASVSALTVIDRETCRRLDLTSHASLTARHGEKFVASTTPIEVIMAAYRSATSGLRPTLTQLEAIRDDIFALTPADQTAARVGMSLAQLIDVVSALGTWLARGAKSAVVTDFVPVERAAQAALHQPAVVLTSQKRPGAVTQTAQEGLFGPVPEKRRASSKKKRRSVKRTAKSGRTVLIPSGYVKSKEQARDVRRALATIVAQYPNQSTLTRFLARVYPLDTQALRGEVVMLTWRLATLNRLGGLDVAYVPRFLHSIADAYDTLELARQRALDGLSSLLDPTVTDLDVLSDAVVKAQWLAEREMLRIGDAIKLVRDGSSHDLVAREREYLARRVNADLVVPTDVASLTEGQARRITEAAGLAVDRPDERVRTRLRDQLVELGLSTDLDQLLPMAIAFDTRGDLESFIEVLAGRAAGDPEWETRLATLATGLA